MSKVILCPFTNASSLIPLAFEETEVQRMLPTGPRFREHERAGCPFWKDLKVSPVSFCNASLVAPTLKHLTAMQETWVRFLGREDPLEKEMATHSSTLAWKIPWTEEPGRLQSMGSKRVGHNWATSLNSLGCGEDMETTSNAVKIKI